jgi:hypothetical protein
VLLIHFLDRISLQYARNADELKTQTKRTKNEQTLHTNDSKNAQYTKRTHDTRNKRTIHEMIARCTKRTYDTGNQCTIESNYLPFAPTWVHSCFLVGFVLLIVCLFCFVRCPIMCLISLLWCPLRFQHTNDVRLPPVVCLRTNVLPTLFVFLCILVSNTFCIYGFVWFFFVLCILCWHFSWLSIFDCPLGMLCRLFIVDQTVSISQWETCYIIITS